MTEQAPGINPIEQQLLAKVIDRTERNRAATSFKVTKTGPTPLSAGETKALANSAFRRARWHRETFLDALDAISRAVRLLDDETLADLIWRGQQTPGRDGYTSTPDGERVSGTSSDGRPIEAVIIARLDTPPIRDPAGIAVSDLMAALWICSNEAATIDRCAVTLLHIHDKATVATGDQKTICAGCNKEIGKATRAHRIDGQPYHAEGSPNCYQVENRRRRDNSPNEQVTHPNDNDLVPSLISEPSCLRTGGPAASEPQR